MGPDLDLTVGIGWGRFAERAVATNPLTHISPKFAVRDTDFGLGGTFSWEAFFRGPEVGVFGGVRYRIPRWRVDLLAAYNSDSYARERGLGTIKD
ncbi:MAG: YjbH domain-containing protein, partial [bacterium]